MMQEDVQHEYYLDYNSHPIYLNRNKKFKVLETRVERHPSFDNVVINKYLVEEVVNS